MIRQGDVLFIPTTDVIPEYLTERGKNDKGIVMEGEATGHHHRIADLEAAEVFRAGWASEESFVRVGPLGVSIVHEEHAPVQLPAGNYRVKIAREYDYLANAARFSRD
jgi:hypothetical protein